MRRLIVFNQVTLDGYFSGVNGDIGWAHRDTMDEEWDAFVAGNATSGGQLLFGRVTYQLMASYWPTAQAARNDPVVAERMNNLPKVVFSKTLDPATWNNTTLVKEDVAGAIRRLKQEPGAHMAIMGSGSIVSQVAREGLIDEYQLVVIPIVLGRGRTMFEGIEKPFALTPTTTRTFRNGNVLLCYEPAA
jgi:dihydrofolate reductase